MSDIKEALQETAEGLFKAGGLSLTTMREIEGLCLPEVTQYTAKDIQQIRLKNDVSQAVFALFLNTSPSTVQKWEAGKKKPNGPSLKLLNLVDKQGIQIQVEVTDATLLVNAIGPLTF